MLLLFLTLGVLEIVVEIIVFIPATRPKATMGIFILMMLFLSFHSWNLFKEYPCHR